MLVFPSHTQVPKFHCKTTLAIVFMQMHNKSNTHYEQIIEFVEMKNALQKLSKLLRLSCNSLDNQEANTVLVSSKYP